MAETSPDHIDLPVPRGVTGHIAYTYAGVRRLLLWRRQFAEIDAALRDAVVRRDETLAALGEATLVNPGAAQRFSGFAQTLTLLEADYTSADSERDQVDIDLAAAEAERRDVLAAYDARIDELRAAMDPIDRRLATNQRALAELERLNVSQADVIRNLEQRLTNIAEKGESLDADEDGEQIASLAEERRGVEARLEALQAERGPREAEIEALRVPIEEDRKRLGDLADDLDAQRERRQSARQEADLQVDELRARHRELTQRARDVGRRRRAALVDLGREALRADSSEIPGAPRARAQRSLAEISRLRRQRDDLERRRMAFDGTPIRRTAIALGVVVGALLLVWIFA